MTSTATSLLVWTLALLALPLIVSTDDDDYDWINEMSYEFPGIENDFTRVTWEHAVNSQEKLKNALQGDAMFLEADVSIGRYSDDPNSGMLMPIMAHPPDTSSDITLQQFLDQVMKSDKHIKLDFKSRMAFSASEYIITEAQIRNSYSKRIWLNADIIPGPINCSKPVVDANYFLSTCVAKFPDTIVSVGWSTCYSNGNFIGGYTPEQIGEMTDALNKNMVLGSVTYAMRAGIAAQSIPIITNLMKTSPADSTLTIWSSPDDPVDVEQLSQLITTIGRDRVFVDVPPDLYARLARLERSSRATSPSLSSTIFTSALLLLSTIFL